MRLKSRLGFCRDVLELLFTRILCFFQFIRQAAHQPGITGGTRPPDAFSLATATNPSKSREADISVTYILFLSLVKISED